MGSLKKELAVLFVLVALVFLGSGLVAQQTPNTCANTCLAQYTAAVRACRGDAGCEAAARAAAKACIATCNL
jgi:hypothetical protein